MSLSYYKSFRSSYILYKASIIILIVLIVILRGLTIYIY
jgi:hypothetical protein